MINSKIYKLDMPIGRIEFFIYTLILFVIKLGIKFSYQYSIKYANTNTSIQTGIKILFAIVILCFVYLTLITIAKRLWSIMQNKKASVITAAIFYITALSSVFFSPLLIIWYAFVLSMYIIPPQKVKTIEESASNNEQ
jgi:uncharacterized membrane protein YhaH (DUF805 family)